MYTVMNHFQIKASAGSNGGMFSVSDEGLPSLAISSAVTTPQGSVNESGLAIIGPTLSANRMTSLTLKDNAMFKSEGPPSGTRSALRE